MSWSVMSDVPNPIVDVNGDVYSGAVLKAYLTGGTTSTSIAIDSAGTSPQTSITANAGGKWEVSGNEILPYIDRKHKWGIFANATDATANTPFYMGPFDNVEKVADATENIKSFATTALAIADTEIIDGDTVRISDRGNSVWDVVLSSTVTENTFNVVQCTGVGTLSLNLRLDGGIKSNQWVVYVNRTTDVTTTIQAMIDYAMPLGLNIEITDACLVTTLNIDKVVDGNTASATVPDDAIVDVNGNDTFFRIFGEGRLLKAGTGNMFDTNLTNTDANAPVVQMVEVAVDIEHTAPAQLGYLISPKYLRFKFTGKTLDGMKFVKSTSVLSQSIYLEGPVNIRRVQGKFWDNDYFNYDIQAHVLMEASADGFWMKNAIGCAITGTLEGLSGTAISYDGAEGLDIRCYFEQNYLDIDGTYGGASSSVAYGVHLSGSYLAKTPTTVSGATVANPVVMTTTAAHGYLNGDKVYIVSVGGMTEINGIVFTVANKTSTTFELSGIDGSSYTTYTEDGNGRIHPFTVKWGQTVNCASIGNRHTGVMHDITSATDGLVTYDIAAEKLSSNSSTNIINKGYDTTFTGTLTGCTTSPTGTIRANKTGQTVTLYIPAIKATSNTTACTVTGMSSDLYPARQQIVTARISENGSEQFGVIVIGTDGVLTLSTGPEAGTFTAANSKGTEVQTITYSLS